MSSVRDLEDFMKQTVLSLRSLYCDSIDRDDMQKMITWASHFIKDIFMQFLRTQLN